MDYLYQWKKLSPLGVHSKITRRPTMKNLANLAETIIIVCLAIIIVTPEICYSLLLRARDKVVDMVGELL